MKTHTLLFTLFISALLQASSVFAGDPLVSIKKDESGYRLYNQGKPYFIQGAGGYSHFDRLQAIGGNSVRLWSTNGVAPYLDQAHALGLMVTLGLDMGQERAGFNYNDEQAVQKQYDQVCAEVLKYKDHPALLVWAVGNELDQFAYNYKVWDAVEKVVQFIHKNDPNHPVTTMLAGVPPQHIKEIITRVPDLDLLAINAFKDLPYIEKKISDAGWTGPYMIGEWGPDGYWESPMLPWGTFIEQTSTEKTAACEARYKTAIEGHRKRCLGAYVYYWGTKQARTHTLLSLFLDGGQEYGVQDMLMRQWTGKDSPKTAPTTGALTIEGQDVLKGCVVKKGSYLTASITAKDREQLVYRWELYEESKEKKEGGDTEAQPPKVDARFDGLSDGRVLFQAPEWPGAYRLFVYIYDGTGRVATANAPFFVGEMTISQNP